MKKVIDSTRVIIGHRGDDGFCGEINMPTWTGSVIASWGGGWEHVSVSPYKKRITPSWDDMCMIKDIFFNEDEWVMQFHPAKSEYVNNMPNCLHLWKPIDEKMPIPPSILTGIKKGQTPEELNAQIKELLG